jgi:hypothetical protein
MIEQVVIEKIQHGEKIHISVSGRNDVIDNLHYQLQEFQHLYSNGERLVNCNSIISLDGSERLDVYVNTIPRNYRETLVDILSSKNQTPDDSLLVIKELHEP